ncbi:hypothetical protein DAEQUDRAFT_696012 [Daedalea quercina L-15889]|uniref:RING-type domain-containing protein n=1 Tax=Daedalea quercina L-15889 TaxID=1314783 RepID=A0A165MWE5_9APHY|nr:hypothetical protein DAEQUDRAFT_696012 [Daedalea quercina L-15889]
MHNPEKDLGRRLGELLTKRSGTTELPRGLAQMDIGQAAPPQPVVAPQEATAAPTVIELDGMKVDVPVDDPVTRMHSYVAQVLEVVPNVLPEHVRVLVERLEPNYGAQVVERILHDLFENADYPKSDPKGKGKRKREDTDDEPEAKSAKVDYASKDREFQGPLYAKQSLERLYADFPTIPVAHIRSIFRTQNQLYAPTYFRLREEDQSPQPPYRRKQPSKWQPKGKEKPYEELEKEIAWVKLKFGVEAVNTAVAEASDAATATANASTVGVQPEGDGIECGCCFSNYPFDKMIQCPDAHLFCTDCMTSYSENLLGQHDANIVCMDQSGCKLAFPESELRRFLTPKLLSLYERVRQRKEIEAAGLEGLEECPHCEYKVVIENDQEKLFRCQNEECMAVTCRQCKKPDHLPKSCKEVEDDKKLDARHTIEEAMTAALMRNCPKCQKAFIKELGCNKMVCPNCRTLSCYVCRKVITGYEHFNNPPPYNGRPDPNKCQLWDSVEQRHSQEVTAAAKKAMEEYKRAHPETSEEDIKVELPPQPVAGPSNAHVLGRPAALLRGVLPPARVVLLHNEGHDLGRGLAGALRPAAVHPFPPAGLLPQAGMRNLEDAQLALQNARARLEEHARARLEHARARKAGIRARMELGRLAEARQQAPVLGLGRPGAPAVHLPPLPPMPPLPPLPPPALPAHLGGGGLPFARPPPAVLVPPALGAGALFGGMQGAAARQLFDPGPVVAPPPPQMVVGRAGGRRARARR